MPTFLITFLCLALACLTGLFMGVFIKGRRRVGWLIFAVGLVGALTSAVVYGGQANEEAKSAGFLSYADRASALKQGVSDPTEWATVRDRFEAAAFQSDAIAKAPVPDDLTTCRSDLSCWGEKAWIVAGVKCPALIEKEAKYSARWTTGFLEPKFSHHRWAEGSQDWVTVIGDKVVFQNGFGAEQRITYECDVDPESKSILAVRIIPGAL